MAFEFAFNNPKYADRKLRLIISSPSSAVPDPSLSSTTAPSSPAAPSDDDCSLEPASKRRKGNSGEKTSPDSESEELYVNTLILGKDSLFFRKIFDGEAFKESSEKIIDIQLSPNEKEPFLDLVKYLYTGKLEAETVEELSLVWQLSQRFLVERCVDLCTQKLKRVQFSLESSCYFIEASTLVKPTKGLQALVDKSLSFLVNHFGVFIVMNGECSSRWENLRDFQQLSPDVLEFLLLSDDLQVIHEDALYDALEAWIKANCQSAEQEVDAWRKLGSLIRWPMMELFRVKSYFERDDCSVLHDFLVEALLYHASSDEEKRKKENTANNSRFRRRAHYAVPVRFLCVSSPINQCLTFFSLTLKDWRCLQNSPKPIYSERFSICGCMFIWLFQIRTLTRRSVSLLLVALSVPPQTLRVHVTTSIWDANSNGYAIRYGGVHLIKKEVRDRVAICIDFGKDVDGIITDSRYMDKDATWFKAELQVGKVSS